MLCFAASEQGPERRVTSDVTRSANAVGDDASLELDLFVISVVTSQSSKRGHGFIVAISCHEPTRRLWQEQHDPRKERAEHDLEGNGEAPSEVWRAVAGSKIDPVCDQSTDGNHTAFDADQQSAVCSLRALSLICGDSTRVHAVSDTSNCPSDDELSHRFVAGYGSDLNNDAEDHDKTAHDNRTPSSQDITKAELENGAREAANLVDCCNESLPCRVASCLRESVVEVGG